MSRKFIALALAVSTTIAGFSAGPARAASDQDIAKILGAAATIFIIGKAIENSRNNDRDDDDKKVRTHSYSHVPNVIRHRENTPTVIPRATKHRDRAIVLPRKCVRRVDGGHTRRVVMGKCLERNLHSARPLPRACRMKVSTQRGERRAYALPCLRNRGYTLARN